MSGNGTSVNFSVERVDRDRLALEVLAAIDPAVLEHQQVGPRLLGVGAREHALGHDLQRQSLRGRDQERDHVGEAELQLPADHGGRDRRAALGQLWRDLQVLLLEEPLLDP
jgi:hypothetical protein